MRKFALKAMMMAILSFGGFSMVNALPQYDDSVTDTISIDDMDPILHTEEEEAEDEGGNTGMIAVIAIVVVVAGAVGYKVATKKKK